MKMESNIRIAYVSHFSHFRMGGQQSMCLMIENLDRSRFTPFCILPSEGELSERLARAGCRCFFVPLYSIKPRHYSRIPATIRAVRRIIKDNSIDIIHPDRDADTTVCGLAKAGSGSKMVWHVRVAARNNKDRLNAGLSDAIIAISDAAKNRLPFAGNKVVKIYNGVNTDVFRPVEDKKALRQKLGLPTDRFIALFAGQMKRQKGIYDLADAASLLLKRLSVHEMPFFCYLGSTENGSGLNVFRDRIAASGLSPHTLIYGYSNAVHEWMQAADALVLPSHSNVEGMGRVLFEAMACGAVPIGTDVPGIDEAVTPETGLLVGEQSPESLAAAISRLMADNSLRAGLAANGRRRAVENFEIARNTRRVEELYCRVVGKR